MMTTFSKADIRKWALVMAVALAIVGGVQYLAWAHLRAATILWIIALSFAVIGSALPAALTPLFRLWMKFAIVLAWFNTRLLLFLAFFLVFAPIGLILRLLGKDLIKERWDRSAKSYWIERTEEPFDRTRYEKQY